MQSNARGVIVVVLIMASLGGCGSSDAAADGGRGGTDALVGCSGDVGTRLLVDLTAAELRAVCDCGAALGGGYGKSKSCDGGTTVNTAVDQATCVARFTTVKSSCTSTVTEALGCAAELDQCNVTGPGCRSFFACLSIDGGV